MTALNSLGAIDRRLSGYLQRGKASTINNNIESESYVRLTVLELS